MKSKVNVIKTNEEYIPAGKKRLDLNTSEGGSNSEELQNLVSNLSLSGVKFVVDRDSTPVRRCVWVMFILAAAMWMSWNIEQQVMLFISRPTSVTTKLSARDTIVFPQVTLCNQNSVRSSKMFELNREGMKSPSLYEVFDRYFLLLNNDISIRTPTADIIDNFTSTTVNVSRTPSDPTDKVHEFVSKYGVILEGLDRMDFLRETAHDKKTFIQRCKWRGRTCGPENFEPVQTNQGICFRFVPDDRNVDIAGIPGGLEVTLHVEQYDYSSSGYRAAGASLSLTGSSLASSSIQEPRMTLSAGSLTSVGVRVREVFDLPVPYGFCGESKLLMFPDRTPYSQTSCLVDCLSRYINSTCGCIEPFMPCAPVSCRICSFVESLTCAKPQTERFYSQGSSSLCDCPPECFSTIYTTSLSSATFSESFMNTLVLTSGLGDPSTVSRKLAIQQWVQLCRLSPDYTDLLDSVSTATKRLISAAERLSVSLLRLSNVLTSLHLTTARTAQASVATLLPTDSDLPNPDSDLDLDSDLVKPLILRYVQALQQEKIEVSKASPEETVTNVADLAVQLAAKAKAGSEFISWAMKTTPLIRPDWEMQAIIIQQVLEFQGLTLMSVNIFGSMVAAQDNSTLNDYRAFQTELENIYVNADVNVTKEGVRDVSDAVQAVSEDVEEVDLSFRDFRSKNKIFLNKAPLVRLYKAAGKIPDVQNLEANFIKQNMVTVQIYLEDLTVEETTKTSAYSAEALVCDIGGSLGLCLGGSILTFIEVIDLLFFIFNKRKTANNVEDFKAPFSASPALRGNCI